jgi:hypothetical protein
MRKPLGCKWLDPGRGKNRIPRLAKTASSPPSSQGSPGKAAKTNGSTTRKGTALSGERRLAYMLPVSGRGSTCW